MSMRTFHGPLGVIEYEDVTTFTCHGCDVVTPMSEHNEADDMDLCMACYAWVTEDFDQSTAPNEALHEAESDEPEDGPVDKDKLALDAIDEVWAAHIMEPDELEPVEIDDEGIYIPIEDDLFIDDDSDAYYGIEDEYSEARYY